MNKNTHMHTLALVAAACFAGEGFAAGGIVPGAPDANDVWCEQYGSFAPTGSATNPFQTLRGALSRVSIWIPSDEVVMVPGHYPVHSEIMSQPCTIMGSDAVSGANPVLLGVPGTQQDLRFLTANTHLFGGGSLMPLCPATCYSTWRDGDRALEIVNDVLPGYGADIVCLQEVWDDFIAVTVITAAAAHGYTYAYYGDYLNTVGAELDDCLHTGLLLLSKHEIVAATSVAFDDEDGEDVLASKGYIEAVVRLPDGHEVGVFTTHLQAQYSGFVARQAQLTQLRDAILAFRFAPGNNNKPVFLLGDFNVVGISTDCGVSPCHEYGTLASLMAGAGLRDAHRNAEPESFCNVDDVNSDCGPSPDLPYTAEQGNDLHAYFTGPSVPSELLDYAMYIGDTTGANSYSVRPRIVYVGEQVRSGGAVTADGTNDFVFCNYEPVTSAYLSDHHSVYASFTIFWQP